MILSSLFLALREIRRNIMRSFLTTLGVVIGVASVIAMVMLGDGATRSITDELAKLGTNMLILQPGQERRQPGMDQNAPPFKMGDVEAIKNEIIGVRAAAPYASKSVTAVFGANTYATAIVGSDNGFMIARDWELSSGRMFEAAETKGGSAVCVLGETTRKALFGENPNAVGSFVRLDRFACEVIGVLQSKGASSFGQDQDDLIVAPMALFQRRLSGNKDVRAIYIAIDPTVSSETIKSDINALLRERRKLRSDQVDNFYIRDTKELVSAFTSTSKTLTILLGSVAAISLLVGGIGIMNIMLVSVTERTREIGVRLAIGATEREVLTQFLVEAVTLSSLGGLIGVTLGLILAYFVTIGFDIPYVYNQTIVTISFAFSMFIGAFFGYFPARKAARLDPIEALRHE
ncbi:MAG: ABC transporter permease [Helicobacteraceae bacterium]|jgi:putative ABC transport system permease protein|nr:ABC transporter permease [Helicobacteraceae bacterium]